jgi:hypothetical protein
MGLSRAASLNVILADRHLNRFAVACGSTSLYDRVKAISPEAIVLLPLPLNETQSLALSDDSLASRVSFHSTTILAAIGVLTGHTRTAQLCRGV